MSELLRAHGWWIFIGVAIVAVMLWWPRVRWSPPWLELPALVALFVLLGFVARYC